MTTLKQVAAASAMTYQRTYALQVFGQWIDHPGYRSPQDDPTTDSEWEAQFRLAGQHEVTISGWMEEGRNEQNQLETIPHVTIDGFERKTLMPPAHLYRAAGPGHESRWNWFESFDMAKLLCDDRAGGLQIYTCDPAEVFGKITIDRTEASGHRAVWTEWIVKPKNVRKINRWRDPFAEIPNMENWKKRGVHALEAASVVGSWFRSTTSKVAPMDRDQGGYWLSQFQYIGQFEAHSRWDASDKSTPPRNTVEPAGELHAPRKLYRGAPDRLKGRWSWTAEPETAQWFIDMFCPDDGKIWECEAGTIFGVINAHVANPDPGSPAEFTEWIIFPKEETIRQWVDVNGQVEPLRRGQF